MYLTRFRFNTARRDSRRLLSAPRYLHAAVQHAFPEPERLQGEDARILWRLDQASRHEAVLYISSPEEPDLSHLVEQAGWPARGLEAGWETRPYDKLLGALEVGQEWAFRLTANPVHTVRTDPDKPKQRLAHVTVAQQIQWVMDRCDRHGFKVAEQSTGEPNLVLNERTWLQLDKENVKARDSKVKIRTATYEGVLVVEEPTALRSALVKGIGKAKAFGCGMMTLAPLSRSS